MASAEISWSGVIPWLPSLIFQRASADGHRNTAVSRDAAIGQSWSENCLESLEELRFPGPPAKQKQVQKAYCDTVAIMLNGFY